MTVDRLLLPRRLRAKALFVLAQLGRECLAEILDIEDLPDFDFGSAVEWRALHPFDRFILRLDLDQPETRDKIAGAAERPVGDGALFAGIFDARAYRGRMQALARQHHTGLHHFLVELAHRREQFRARHDAGFAVLVGLYNHHESHRHAPVWFQFGGPAA